MILKTLSQKQYKDYFTNLDCLANFAEINYSIFSKYFCTAGCKICYVKEEMKEAKKSYSISNNIKEELEFLSKLTNNITFCDDLFYIKKHHFEHYELIKEYSNLMSFGGMTDNQWLKVSSLLLEFNFKNIDESSFTDEFFYKNFKSLEPGIDKVLKKYKLRQIKIIETDSLYTQYCEIYFSTRNITVHKQKLIKHTTDNIPVLNDNTLGNSLFFANGKMYFTLLDNIQSKNEIANISNINNFIFKMLEKKLNFYSSTSKELYKLYNSLNEIEDGIFYTIKLAEELKINENFNFIPKQCFNTIEKFKEYMINNGWYNTEYGLLNLLKFKHTNDIIPLYTWKEE